MESLEKFKFNFIKNLVAYERYVESYRKLPTNKSEDTYEVKLADWYNSFLHHLNRLGNKYNTVINNLFSLVGDIDSRIHTTEPTDNYVPLNKVYSADFITNSLNWFDFVNTEKRLPTIDGNTPLEIVTAHWFNNLHKTITGNERVYMNLLCPNWNSTDSSEIIEYFKTK